MHPRILIVQNNLESPAGLIQEEAVRRGIEPHVLHGAADLSLPADAADYDGLLILGGTMNALADDACPYFQPLIKLALQMDQDHRPVMGLCLGAQILARAWGGMPRIGAAPEYGFVPLCPMARSPDDPLLGDVPPATAFMQWHDDTYDLPPSAIHLMRSDTCENQVWRAGNVTYGFQPHIEVTQPILQAWGRMRMQLTGEAAAPALLKAAADEHLPAATQAARLIAGRFAELIVDGALARRG